MSQPAPLAVLVSAVRPRADGHGPARRAYGWVVELARSHRVHVLVANAETDIAAFGDAALPATLSFVPPPPNTRRPQGRQLLGARSLIAALPWRAVRERAWAEDWISASPGLAERIAAALHGETPARVVVFRLFLHDVAALLPGGCRPEIDLDDWESRTRWSLALVALRRGRLPMARTLAIGAWHYRSLERHLLGVYACAWVAAEEDVSPLARLSRVVVRVHPNRWARPALPPSLPGAPPMLLFVGTMNYIANEDAALFLAERIAPALRRHVPGKLRIVVVGLGARPSLAARFRRAGIEYRGDVDDLAPLYAEASIAVAPVRSGGGTKFKVIEAFVHGRPVVATPHAARGLGAVPGTHLLVAEGAEPFAQACARLLREPALAEQLAAQARALLDRSRLCLAAP